MALPHAQELDVINVAPLGDALRDTVSTSLIRTSRLQLLHVVLPVHHDMPSHRVDEPCVLHCLEGHVEVTMAGGLRRLKAGELVVLPPGQAHGVRARADSAVLVTLLHPGGERGDAAGLPVPPAIG